MIELDYDHKHNTVIIEFIGKVDAIEGEKRFPEIPKFIPKHQKGFNLLVDLSAAERIDPKIRESIKTAMDLVNAHGVAKVIRVIPGLERDIGLNIMSHFHYSEAVKIVTLKSRKEAEEHLRDEKTS